MDLQGNHEYFSHKYKVSKKIRENLNLIGNKFKDFKSSKDFFNKRLKENLYYVGVENLKILYSISLLDKKKIVEKDIAFLKNIKKITVPKFPFDGKFLIKKGIQEGKKIGIILKEAEQVWLQNNFNLSSKEFEVVIKKNTISN